MRRYIGVVALATMLGGCSRCGGGPTQTDAGVTVDAGAPASPAVAHGRLPATDLRSAVILIYPEYRGVYAVAGRAWLERVVQLSGDVKPAEVLPPLLKAKGFTDISEAEGTVKAKRAPFEFEATREGDQLKMQIAMPVTEKEIGRLLYSPAPISTEHMQFMMPALPKADVKGIEDTFTLDLGYGAKPERANFLIRQVVEGLIAVGWAPTTPLTGWAKEKKPDGGVGDIPLQMTAIIHQEDTGGTLEVRRNAGRVLLHYTQPLVSPPVK